MQRNVPHTSPDCTLKGAREAFLSRVPIPESQIHAIAEGLTVEVRGTAVLQVCSAQLHGSSLLAGQRGACLLRLIMADRAPCGSASVAASGAAEPVPLQ